MKIRRSLLKDTVTVATYEGDGAYGPINADPINVRVLLDVTRRMVRDTNGDEQVSEVTLTCHPATRVVNDSGQHIGTVDPVAVFTPESPVTINGRTSRVLAVKPAKVRSVVMAVEVTCA